MQSTPLTSVFSEFPFSVDPGNIPDIPITGIAMDSRSVEPGYLFVAMHGQVTDGHEFIPKAIAKGAAVVVGERDLADLAVPYLRVEDSRKSLAWLAAAFYDWPARKLTVIGVTGTDGKTTTCNLIYRILLSAGIHAGMISTVNALIGNEELDTGFHVTTPDALDVQRYLAKMVDAGQTHVVLETTSHGWAQHRVDACEFDIGVVTNITHEHLDEHGSYEEYSAAKGRLITALEKTFEKPQGNPRLAVLNYDDSSYGYLANLATTARTSYSLGDKGDILASEITFSPTGMRFQALGTDFRVPVQTNLVGKYNVSNCLAAFTACVVGLGIDPQSAADGIATLPGIPGRMEVIDMGQGFTAIVDFAHTPNALKVTLETAREITNGRVIAVIGSAGLRDKEKRRMMAEISAELADLTVLTAEDPRSESLDDILEEMAAGVKSRDKREGESFWRVPDRGEAIKVALQLAKPGDIVLSCGKGHEQSMCFGAIEYLWDDRTAMRAALADFLGISGPLMPYLPTRDMQEADWLQA